MNSVAPAGRFVELPLSSHVWRQIITASVTGSGFHRSRHQQEGRGRPRLSAADANCLLSVTDHCLRSRNYVNVIVAGNSGAAMADHG
jgi:xylulose-5-phosphate/fructose-6-phosphate phosphoketolase